MLLIVLVLVAEFRDIGGTDVCVLSNIKEPDGTQLVVLKAHKKLHVKNSTARSLFRYYDPHTQDDPQTLLSAISWRNCFSLTVPLTSNPAQPPGCNLEDNISANHKYIQG